MTERDINKLLIERAVPEYMPTRDMSGMIGIMQSTIRSALATGELPKAARGTVSRGALAVWMSRRPDVIAQMLSASRPCRSRGELEIVSCRDDYTVTIRSQKYCMR